MRLDRIKGISQAIRQTPHLFNQGEWGEPDPELHLCETAGCTAGWAVALYGEQEILHQYRIQSSHYNAIELYATELLELTPEEASTLFDSRWPGGFLDEPEQVEVFTKLEENGIHTYSFRPTPDQAARILEKIGDGELSIIEAEVVANKE